MDNESISKLIRKILLTSSMLEMFGIILDGYNIELYERVENKPFAYIDSKEKIIYVSHDSSTSNIEQEVALMIGFCVHEILHLISLHELRSGNKDLEMWTMATDHVVNEAIMSLAKIPEYAKVIKLPPHAIHFKGDEYKNKSAEQIYKLLVNDDNSLEDDDEKTMVDNENNMIYKFGQKSNSNDDNSDEDNEESSEDESESENREQKKLKEMKEKYSYQCGNMHKKPKFDNSKEEEEYQEECSEIYHNARGLWESQKDNFLDNNSLLGSKAYGLMRFFEITFKVAIPWYELLLNNLIYQHQSDEYRSWMCRHKYFRNIRIPGSKKNDNIKKLLIIVDTSASICETDLNKFASVICDATDFYNPLQLIVHDFNVHKNIEFDLEYYGVENFKSELSNCFTGDGGTSHQEVFLMIEELLLSGDEISMIIFLTDFDSDILSIHENYKWCKFIPTVWVLNNDNFIEHALVMNEMYGHDVIAIDRSNT